MDWKDGERFKKLSHQVEVGDVFVATEGQEIYFDGTVVSGRGFLNESSLTGEAFPVSKKNWRYCFCQYGCRTRWIISKSYECWTKFTFTTNCSINENKWITSVKNNKSNC